MSEFKEMMSSNRKLLESYIKTEIFKNTKKLRNRYPPISEIIDGTLKILKIKNFYEMRKEFKNCYLIKTRNYNNIPKIRYFLAIILASQSSDLLVSVAKKIIKNKGDIKLIQFSIHPKNFRISLLSLKEVKNKDEFLNSIKFLKDLRIKFRKKLDNIGNLVENR